VFRGVWLRILIIQNIFEAHKVPSNWENGMLFIAPKSFKVHWVVIALAGTAAPSTLSEKLGYTLMTMTRALNELKALEIGEVYREGRERIWTFIDKRTLWAQARSLLRNPTKKRIWVKNHPCKIAAGLNALAHFSSLSLPSLPVFAIGASRWKSIKQSKITEVPSSDGAAAELEIWDYDPALFAKDGFVDPISLYCSLKTNEDERIELCLEEMMDKIAW
jgi:hypothetical protein